MQSQQQHGPPAAAHGFIDRHHDQTARLRDQEFQSIIPQAERTDPEASADGDPVGDLTDTVGQLSIAEDGQLRYFGAPSYFNLLRSASHVTTTSPEQDNHGWDIAIPGNYLDIGLSLQSQNHLLDLYWRWQNPWQYLVHRAAFGTAVERGIYDDYCTPLLLRCILSLAARYCDHPEARLDPSDANTAGELLAIQAKDILSIEIEHPSTSTVAALAIMALREMSVNKESLGWTYIGDDPSTVLVEKLLTSVDPSGMAVRIAYNLGLNLDCQKWVDEGKISEEQAEIRRITWWGCYLLDKYVKDPCAPLPR